MAGDGQSVERLREYLRTLKPQALAMLVAELERGLLRGDDTAGSKLILQELRHAIRAAAQPMPRFGDAARMFFLPLEPFLIDSRPDHKRMGRIAGASLEPIWEWIVRDLMPAEAKALTEDVNRALQAGDRTKAEQVVRALHDRAIQRIRAAVAPVDLDEKARRKLTVQVSVLGEIENTVSELRTELKAGRPVATMLKEIHDAARGLRAEMDLSYDSPLSRQLAAIAATFRTCSEGRSNRRPAVSGACRGRVPAKKSLPDQCSIRST